MAQNKDVFAQIAEALAGVGQTGLEAIGGAGDRFIKYLTGGNAVQEIPSSVRKVGPTPLNQDELKYLVGKTSGYSGDKGHKYYITPKQYDEFAASPERRNITYSPMNTAGKNIDKAKIQNMAILNGQSTMLPLGEIDVTIGEAPAKQQKKSWWNRGDLRDEVAADEIVPAVKTPTPDGTKPVAPPQNVPRETFEPQGDILGGLKKLAWDDRNPMERMMLLGALARVVTGAREKAAGMEGGGLESENLLAALAGGGKGYVAGRKMAEEEKTKRMATQQKTEAKAGQPDIYEKARVADIKSVLGAKPDFTTAAKASTLLSDAGINIADYPSPREAWKQYFIITRGAGAGETFDRLYPTGGSTSEKVEQKFDTGGDKTNADNSLVEVTNPKGKRVKIKRSQLADALKSGYKQ